MENIDIRYTIIENKDKQGLYFIDFNRKDILLFF